MTGLIFVRKMAYTSVHPLHKKASRRQVRDQASAKEPVIPLGDHAVPQRLILPSARERQEEPLP